MKIFLVSPSLGNGGAERVAMALAKGFAKKGHDVTLLVKKEKYAEYSLDNIKIADWSSNKTFLPLKLVDYVRHIRKLIKVERPDVVIGFMQSCSFYSQIATLGLNVPVIMTEHSPFEIGSKIKEKRNILTKDGLVDLLNYTLDRIYPVVTVLTDADKVIAAQKHIHQAVVMPNPSTYEVAAAVPEGKQKIILGAGRIENWEHKGWDVLIKAWGKIAYKHPEWKLCIAGKGTPESIRQTMEWAKQSHCENQFELLGFQQDMKNVCAGAEIFALSSRWEGLPMVLLEAMSQGCAPVATANLGRTKEILPSDEYGLICNPEDVEALSDCLDKMISDDSYRKSVQQNVLDRIKYYSMDNTISRWEKLFNKLGINQIKY